MIGRVRQRAFSILLAFLCAVALMDAACAFAEGLTGYYYNRAKKSGPVVTGPHDHKVIDPKVDFATSTWNWTPFGMEKHFSVYWTGWIYVDAAKEHFFATFSDDGSSLFIDDRKVVDNNRGYQEPQWQAGSIDLSSGYHKIEILYFNWRGSGGIGLYWDLGEGFKIVPGERLFPEDFMTREQQ